MDIKALLLLIFGHMITDTTQGGLPAVLPMLKEVHGLSYAQAGALVMTMNLTSSVIQPLFGYLTDRWRLTWLVPLGVGISGLGFGLVGVLPSYPALLAAVVVSGLGVASFHPESFKNVLGSAGPRKVVWVSWFMVGGNLGFALGPLLIMAYCAWLGLKGTLLFMLPGLMTAGLFLAYWRRLARREGPAQPTQPPAQPPQPLKGRLRPLAILITAVTLRSWVHTGVTAFVPFYYVNVLGGEPVAVGRLLTTFLLAGVLGTMAGAPLAERVGLKRFFVMTVTLVTPLLIWFLNVQGALLYLVMALTGAFLVSTWSVIMVMGQQILPDRAGMVSGLLVGLAMGMGGIGATVMGLIADRWGVTLVLQILTVLPLLSALAGYMVPLPPQRPATRTAS